MKISLSSLQQIIAEEIKKAIDPSLGKEIKDLERTSARVYYCWKRSSGRDIAKLQKALNQFVEPALKTDNVVGPRTTAAIMTVQKAMLSHSEAFKKQKYNNKLSRVDGVWGPLTRNSLIFFADVHQFRPKQAGNQPKLNWMPFLPEGKKKCAVGKKKVDQAQKFQQQQKQQQQQAASMASGVTLRYPLDALPKHRIGDCFGLIPRHPRNITKQKPNKYRNHKGVDMGGETGDPIYSSHAGKVVRAGPSQWGGGNVVVIQSLDKTFFTLYAHLSQILVEKGQSIDAPGLIIGRMGETGHADNPHLHFALYVGSSWKNSKAADPVPEFAGNNPTGKYGIYFRPCRRK